MHEKLHKQNAFKQRHTKNKDDTCRTKTCSEVKESIWAKKTHKWEMDTVLPAGPRTQATKRRKEKTKKQTKKAKVLAKEYQTMFKRSKEMVQSKESTIFKEMSGLEH